MFVTGLALDGRLSFALLEQFQMQLLHHPSDFFGILPLVLSLALAFPFPFFLCAVVLA